MLGPLGIQEMIFIFVLALLVFGPKKLPELGKTFGKGMAEFRRASNELKSTFQTEMDNIERETKIKETADEIKTEVNKQISTNYDDSEDDYYEYDDTPSDSGASATKSETGSSTAETSASPTVDGDSSVGSSNGQSAPAVASSEPKPAESSANASSETKAS